MFRTGGCPVFFLFFCGEALRILVRALLRAVDSRSNNFRPLLSLYSSAFFMCVQAALRAFWARPGLPDSRGTRHKIGQPCAHRPAAIKHRLGVFDAVWCVHTAAVLPSGWPRASIFLDVDDLPFVLFLFTSHMYVGLGGRRGGGPKGYSQGGLPRGPHP